MFPYVYWEPQDWFTSPPEVVVDSRPHNIAELVRSSEVGPNSADHV